MLTDTQLRHLRDTVEHHAEATATVVDHKWVVRCKGCNQILQTELSESGINAAIGEHQLTKMQEAMTRWPFVTSPDPAGTPQLAPYEYAPIGGVWPPETTTPSDAERMLLAAGWLPCTGVGPAPRPVSLSDLAEDDHRA